MVLILVLPHLLPAASYHPFLLQAEGRTSIKCAYSLLGLRDPQLETSKLFIAEPSRGGRPGERQGAHVFPSYRICRNPSPFWEPCVHFWIDRDLSLENPMEQ